MADVVVTITRQEIYAEIGRRSALATETDPFYKDREARDKQLHQLHGESDRITGDYVSVAAKEVLKLFVSRQGDVTGVPYENDGTNITYRFNEASPVLNHAVSIKARLTANVKEALIQYVLFMAYKGDNNSDKVAMTLSSFRSLSNEIMGDLYRLHD